MTSQSLNTNKKRAGFGSLFRFSARQFWTTTLLFTIVLFFILPVPVMMTISERAPLDMKDVERLTKTFSDEWVSVIRYFVITTMSIFGVVVSCSRFAYLKNKVSVDFYHSLPIKRGRLFTTQLAVSAISVAIPYIFNILFTLIVLAANGLFSKLLIVNVLIMTLEAFIYLTFFFSLSTLIGMASGLGAVQLTLTIVAAFIVPVGYLLTVAFISIFNNNLWIGYYLRTDFFEASTPALRFLLNSQSLSVFEALSLLLISVAMLFGAYVVYMKRKSERAGTPVVFTALGEVIKYVLVFLGTLGGGLLFYFIMSDMLWTVFGMICGTVLVFMLTNTILQKTARLMFKGWKGLCIYVACAAIAFFILVTNTFGINTNVPPTSFTSRVEVRFDGAGGTMEFTDKEVIDAVRTIYTEGAYGYSYNNALSNYLVSSAVPYDTFYHSNSRNLTVVFYPKLGIPVAKSVRIYRHSDFVDEYKTLLNSDEFGAQYATAFDEIEGNGNLTVGIAHLMAADDGIAYEYYAGNRSWGFDKLTTSSARAKELGLDLLVKANQNVDFDFFQQQTFGNVYAYEYIGDGIDASFPLFISMTELEEHYIDNGFLTMPQDKMLQNLARAIKEIEISKIGNDKVEKLIVNDTDEILEILKAADNPFGSNYSPFTLVETDYNVSYTLEIADAHDVTYSYDEYGNETVTMKPKDPENIYTYTSTYMFGFLLGRVPDFIIEHFGS